MRPWLAYLIPAALLGGVVASLAVVWPIRSGPSALVIASAAAVAAGALWLLADQTLRPREVGWPGFVAFVLGFAGFPWSAFYVGGANYVDAANPSPEHSVGVFLSIQLTALGAVFFGWMIAGGAIVDGWKRRAGAWICLIGASVGATSFFANLLLYAHQVSR